MQISSPGSTASRRTRHGAWRLGVMLGALALAALGSTAARADDDGEGWPMFGQNASNTANAKGDAIKASNVSQLKLKWTFTTGGEVSARAAVVDEVAYVPDWGGNLWAINAKKGTKVWGRQLSDYGLSGSASGVYHSRTSPAVVDGVVYLGTQEGAWLLAVSAKTGNLLWKTQLETADPLANITASPVVVDGVLYIGVSTLQEFAAANPAFPCCSGRGSVVAVRTGGSNRGSIKWKVYTVPEGYTGGGVWGSNFVVDKSRGSLFVGTGNNLSVPTAPAYVACIAGGGTAASCNSPQNHVDSILSLDINTGAVKWAFRAVNWNNPFYVDGSDNWNVACAVGFGPGQGNCPAGAGPDFDFASAPNLITYGSSSGKKTILGAGQKSGIYYALNPDTGSVLWRTQVGPGSSLGGMEWGSASDGKRIYVSIANLYGIPTAVGGAGSWAALNPENGSILWQVGDPNGAIAMGALTVAGGVVFVSSMAGSATAPTMLALNAANGQTLWSFAAGSSVNAGASIADGVVYWGSGYAHLGIPGFTTNNKFYAFSRDKD